MNDTLCGTPAYMQVPAAGGDPEDVLEALYFSAIQPGDFSGSVADLRRAYFELCLVVAEKLYPATEGELSTPSVYSSLSSFARKQIDPAEGGVGVTNLYNAPRTLVTLREQYKATTYKIGQDTVKAFGLLQSSDDIVRLARAARVLFTTGDLTALELITSPTTDPSSSKTSRQQTTTEAEAAGPAQATATTTAIEPSVDLGSSVKREGLESVLYVAAWPFNGAGVVSTGAYTTETRPGFCAVQRRVDLLSEDEIEELLGSTPLGTYPWADIPTVLYERIVDWAPIVAESEPLAAILQFNLVSHARDNTWHKKGDCVGIPIPCTKIAAAFGMAAQTVWDRSLNTGMLLELYRRHVDPDFRWSGWHGGKGKARVIKSHSIPDDIITATKELMLSPEDHDDWTYLINGKSANSRRWTSQLREERRERIEEHEPIIPPPDSARRIQAYLNGLSQTTFGHGGYGIFSPDVLDKGIWEASTLDEERRRDQELRKLYWMRKFPQPLYLPCDRSPRQKCDHHNQAMNLPSHILRSMYHERDYELDQSKAHLASYVPVAKREGLDVPVLEDYLSANMNGEIDLWTELADSFDARAMSSDKARRKAVKRAYSAVYGSARQNVLYRIYKEYGRITGEYLDNFDPIEPLLSHPLMEELFATRDKLEVIIDGRRGLEDADGCLIPLSAWDKTKDKANRWRGVMSYVNASYEQKLMGELFEEAQATKDRDSYTEFTVWLYQADGVTVRMDRRVRSHHGVIERLQSAVAEKAEELGVPTELEVDWPEDFG